MRKVTTRLTAAAVSVGLASALALAAPAAGAATMAEPRAQVQSSGVVGYWLFEFMCKSERDADARKPTYGCWWDSAHWGWFYVYVGG